jgi:hypothetical protein
MAVIPDDLVRLLQSPCSMSVGTRDASLEPHYIRAFGAVVRDDRQHVTLFVLGALAGPTVRDLEDNGRIAFAVVDFSFKAYQMKGRFVAAREARPDEEKLQDEYVERASKATIAIGIPDTFWPVVVCHPAMAITFAVEEIFDQTPGPGAGTPVG